LRLSAELTQAHAAAAAAAALKLMCLQCRRLLQAVAQPGWPLMLLLLQQSHGRMALLLLLPETPLPQLYLLAAAGRAGRQSAVETLSSAQHMHDSISAVRRQVDTA
jgi:hypothetical protein